METCLVLLQMEENLIFSQSLQLSIWKLQLFSFVLGYGKISC